MHGITATPLLSGVVNWMLWGPSVTDREDGYEIRFPLRSNLKNREALARVKSILERDGNHWLKQVNSTWVFDVVRFREVIGSSGQSTHLDAVNWLKGVVILAPEIDHSTARDGKQETIVSFRIVKEEYLLNHGTKVFLSHKGADKPKVRSFFSVLQGLGFDPWLDEDAMTAGMELHRGILQGFKDSCAAVFFITPNFRDEAYLRTEVNYAVQQKNEKGERFAIVTLVFDGAGKAHVPDLLHGYVWKEPKSDLEALSEIVRAVPITLGVPNWRSGV